MILRHRARGVPVGTGAPEGDREAATEQGKPREVAEAPLGSSPTPRPVSKCTCGFNPAKDKGHSYLCAAEV